MNLPKAIPFLSRPAFPLLAPPHFNDDCEQEIPLNFEKKIKYKGGCWSPAQPFSSTLPPFSATFFLCLPITLLITKVLHHPLHEEANAASTAAAFRFLSLGRHRAYLSPIRTQTHGILGSQFSQMLLPRLELLEKLKSQAALCLHHFVKITVPEHYAQTHSTKEEGQTEEDLLLR